MSPLGLLDLSTLPRDVIAKLEILHRLLGHAPKDHPLLRHLAAQLSHVQEVEGDLEEASADESSASRATLKRDAAEHHLRKCGSVK